MFGLFEWSLAQGVHHQRYRLFELRIVSARPISRHQLDWIVRRYTMVLDFPFPFQTVESNAWRINESAIHESWVIINTNEPTPSSGSHERTQLGFVEIPGQ